VLVAQAIGRLGNWFNSELFGRPTTLPWGLEIAPQYRPAGYADAATFHPTFLYELLWNLLVAGLLVVLDRRFRLGHGKVFALYVALYSAGRFWIEALRVDTVNQIAGFRLNNYTAAVAFLVAVLVLLWLMRNRPGREEVVEQARPGTRPAEPEEGPEGPADDADDVPPAEAGTRSGRAGDVPDPS
ncbi:MAG TPA: prolipoprotein diacylglyceryl transferase family protein, partial [Thermoanaerobaculia bacterium]